MICYNCGKEPPTFALFFFVSDIGREPDLTDPRERNGIRRICEPCKRKNWHFDKRTGLPTQDGLPLHLQDAQPAKGVSYAQ